MKIKLFVIFFVLTFSCIFSQPKVSEISENIITENNWKKYFDNSNIDGTFILYNLSEDSLFVYNPARAEKRYLPASTFKILNSLISLETGVLKDENEIIKWDGVKRFYDMWNKDQNMKSALKYSCVWFYQELARRVGFDNYHKYLDSVNFGNKKLGDKIDTFWLEGDLEISPVEQIIFLEKFIKGNLPFKERNLKIVKNILMVDSTGSYKMYAKTGWTARVKEPDQIGWYIGFVENQKDIWIFALNIGFTNDEDAAKRIEISRNILKEKRIIK
jgi:beta-lactamase class D